MDHLKDPILPSVWESCVWGSCVWGSCVWGSCVWESCVWGSCVWESCVWEKEGDGRTGHGRECPTKNKNPTQRFGEKWVTCQQMLSTTLPEEFVRQTFRRSLGWRKAMPCIRLTRPGVPNRHWLISVVDRRIWVVFKTLLVDFKRQYYLFIYWGVVIHELWPTFLINRKIWGAGVVVGRGRWVEVCCLYDVSDVYAINEREIYMLHM